MGRRLDCRVMCVSERTGCRGVSEPSGAAHVDEKVANAPFGRANAGRGTVRWSLRIPSRGGQRRTFHGRETDGTYKRHIQACTQ